MRRDELNRKACAWLLRGGIVAVGNVLQSYTVNSIQKKLTL